MMLSRFPSMIPSSADISMVMQRIRRLNSILLDPFMTQPSRECVLDDYAQQLTDGGLRVIPLQKTRDAAPIRDASCDRPQGACASQASSSASIYSINRVPMLQRQPRYCRSCTTFRSSQAMSILPVLPPPSAAPHRRHSVSLSIWTRKQPDRT